MKHTRRGAILERRLYSCRRLVNEIIGISERRRYAAAPIAALYNENNAVPNVYSTHDANLDIESYRGEPRRSPNIAP